MSRVALISDLPSFYLAHEVLMLRRYRGSECEGEFKAHFPVFLVLRDAKPAPGSKSRRAIFTPKTNRTSQPSGTS
jgi:hypothetical protein